jgi:hypothetical protein
MRASGADFKPEQASVSANIHPGSMPHESPQTTHISIMDGAGNAVAFTTTLNLSFGNKIVVEGAGFLLNNEMDDFSVRENTPNAYGLIGRVANSIEPGKRMLSSMTPTLVVDTNGHDPRDRGSPAAARSSRRCSRLWSTCSITTWAYPTPLRCRTSSMDAGPCRVEPYGISPRHAAHSAARRATFAPLPAVLVWAANPSCASATLFSISDPREDGGAAGF